MFGMTGWILAHKNDKPDGDQKITFTTRRCTANRATGRSAVAGEDGDPLGRQRIRRVPARPPGLSGLWSAGKGLSHASIYYIGETPASQVPLPAAGLLLLGVSGGLGSPDVARAEASERLFGSNRDNGRRRLRTAAALSAALDKASAWLEAVRIAGFTEAEANRFFGRPGIDGVAEADLTPRAAAAAKRDFLARHAELLAAC